MRFLILVKATQDSKVGVMPEEKLVGAMTSYHGELARAGALLDTSGLQASSRGWRITDFGGHRSFVDGPFAETKELIAATWSLINNPDPSSTTDRHRDQEGRHDAEA